MTIGVAGLQGSFSEEAAEHYCHQEGLAGYKISYLTTVENVLDNLNSESIDLGIFPIENSNGGVVLEAVQAMSKYIFKIEKIFEIDVQQNLLCLKEATRGEIDKIASHDQAIKQCKMYLKRVWPKTELIEWEDTAKAAKDLSTGKLDKSTAVIAPKKSAELYGLQVLEKGIQDLKFNFTSFLAVKKP